MKKTKSKRLFIILAIMILLSISAVSATDASNDDGKLSAGDLDDGIALELSNANDNTLRGPGSNGNTFSDLQGLIDEHISSGEDLILDKDYIHNNSDPNEPDQIYIQGKITILGNGKTIDANSNDTNKIAIFNLTELADNVVLDNITFINANSRAIYVCEGALNCIVNNSVFHDNNMAEYDHPGAAIYWAGDDGTISNSLFYDNAIVSGEDDDADNRGGAIFWEGNNGTVEYCNFTRNYARTGGAISWGRVVTYKDPQGEEHINWTATIMPEKGVIYKCNFTDNSVFYHGMALASACVNLSISESNFTNNSGVYSAVLIEVTGNYTNISNCIFKDNNASGHDYFDLGQYSGSAALETLAANTTVEYCDFINNNAYSGDYRFNSSVYYDDYWGDYTITGVLSIEYIDLDGSIKQINIDDDVEASVNLIADYCYKDGDDYYFKPKSEFKLVSFIKHVSSYVGAAKTGNSALDSVFDHCNFINNSANAYGALEIDAKDNTVKYSNFTNNTANDGKAGAIQWYGENGLLLNSSLINNNATLDGGAIYWSGVNGAVADNCYFFDNTASYDGGAIYWHGYDGEVADDCYFFNNTANNGGAIYWDGDDGYVAVIGYFFNNTARYDGGAIYWIGEEGEVTDNCYFFNNTASCDGGAIYWDGYGGDVTNNCHFSNNTANNGGAIYWSDDDGYVANNCYFFNNTASYNGGAIYWIGDNGEVTDNCYFYNNTAKETGGAIYWGIDAKDNKNGNPYFLWVNSSDIVGLVNDPSFDGDVLVATVIARPDSDGAFTFYREGGLLLKILTDNPLWYTDDDGNLKFELFLNGLDLSNLYDEDHLKFCFEDYEDPDNSYSVNCQITCHDKYINFNPGDDNGNPYYMYVNENEMITDQNDGDYDPNVIVARVTLNPGTTEGSFIIAMNGGADILYWEDVTEGNGLYRDDDGNLKYNISLSKLDLSKFNSGDVIEFIFQGNNGYNEQVDLVVGLTDSTIKFYPTTCGFEGNVSDCEFINNSAYYGGAVYWYAGFGDLSDCNFTNNSADQGGAILWDGYYGEVTCSNFTINHAEWKAGAIFFPAENGIVSDSYFINNTADFAGAIVWDGKNGNITNSNFTNNSADTSSGAIYFNSYKGIISDCNFTNNFASADDSSAGAIWVTEDNTDVANCDFTANHAGGSAGAVLWYGGNGNIINSNFTNNYARDYAGALSMEWTENNIDYCNFTNNTADLGGAIYADEADNVHIHNSNFTDNRAHVDGGAIYWKTGVDGEVYYSNFIDNNATNEGGAIYWNEGYGDIIFSSFNGNNATKGSAIFKSDTVDIINLINVTFGRNRANSSYIDIPEPEGNATYALANVTIKVYLIAFDNIANAIWNDNNNAEGIYLANITCEFSDDGNKRYQKSFNVGNALVSPDTEYTSDSKLWQSDREDAQLLDILITDETGTIVYYNLTKGVVNPVSSANKKKNGVLSAVNVPVSEDVQVTGTEGNRTIQLSNLKAGKYLISAKHEWDEYYTDTSSTSSFIIYDLNVTKTTLDKEVFVGENITYNITITANGDINSYVANITLTDLIPKNLTLIKYYTTWSFKNPVIPENYDKDWTFDGEKFTISNMLDADLVGQTYVTSVLRGGDSITLTLICNATQPGLYNNTAKVKTDTMELNATSNNTLVKPLANLTVVKKSNATDDLLVGDLVNFTITVTNNGPSDATDINITDELEDAFDIQQVGNTTTYKDSHKIIWNIPSLAKGNSTFVWFTVKVNTNGTFNNTAIVRSAESNETNSTTNVTAKPKVDLSIIKTATPDHVTVGELVTFTITVTNNGPSDATGVEIGDDINPVFKIVKINNGGYRDANAVGWEIPYLASGNSTTVSVVVNTTKEGNYENIATVHCKENDTRKENKTNVTVDPDVRLSIEKTTNLTENANVSDKILFTIKVTNIGLSNATNVVITDDILEVFNITDVGMNGQKDGNRVTWVIPKLDAGNSTTVTVEVNATVNGIYYNIAVANCEENKTNVTDEVPVIVEPAVAFEIIKTATPDSLIVDDNVTFTIKITNLGPSNATNVNITDVLNDTFKFDGKSASDRFTYSNHIIVWNIGDLANGTSKTVSFNVTVLSIGNFTNVASVNCDENTTGASNKTNITVNPAPSFVNGSDVNVTCGEPIVVNYDSTNATNVTYEIFDSEGHSIVNGTVGPNGTLPTLDLPIGEYKVNWTTIVDGNHTSNTNTSVIIVNPAPSFVKGENVTVYYGDPINVNYDSTNATNVTYEIFDSEGKSVVNGTVGPDGTIPVKQLPVGNYTVNWTTIVDENHTSATNTSTITVLPIPTHVSIGNVTAYPGENVTIPINVTIFDDEPFNGDVAVVMPDNTTQIVPVVNGTGTLTWQVPEDYTPDKYPDSIKFPGSEIYAPSNGTGIVEVIQIPTHVSVGNVTTFAGMNVTIPINVTADNGLPFNGNVTITFPDGKTDTVEITNGTGTTTWFVPYDYAPDKYPDNVKFNGTNKYLPSEGNGTITVIKIPVDITVGNVTVHPGDDVVIPIEVTPRDGSVFNGKITVELPDGSIHVVEIINGKGKVPWKVPENYKPGKYLVKAHSNETNIYYPADGTGIITVIVDPVPDDGNHTHKDTSKKDIPQNSLAKYETGNPIIALLAVFAFLGIGIKRRK